MFVVLLLALLCVPLLELYVIIQVAGGAGTGWTILLLVAVSVAGAWMVRRSGLGVLNQIRARLQRGELPAGELVDGLLILLAGALMLTPGFLTDGVGLLLLFPPTRLLARSLLMRHFVKKLKRVTFIAKGAETVAKKAETATRVSKRVRVMSKHARRAARMTQMTRRMAGEANANPQITRHLDAASEYTQKISEITSKADKGAQFAEAATEAAKGMSAPRPSRRPDEPDVNAVPKVREIGDRQERADTQQNGADQDGN